jgi:deazaflavin-dependent oxidoreductase (nitroreductase family)
MSRCGFERERLRAMNLLARLFVKGHVVLYQSSDGKRGGMMRGMPVLLLTTRGRKSGRERTVPVVPHRDGDTLYVIASMGGAPQNPAWYVNLKANPEVGVQLGANKFRARAQTLEEPERARIWAQITAAMPNFADYQKRTSRIIPVVRLVRL